MRAGCARRRLRRRFCSRRTCGPAMSQNGRRGRRSGVVRGGVIRVGGGYRGVIGSYLRGRATTIREVFFWRGGELAVEFVHDLYVLRMDGLDWNLARAFCDIRRGGLASAAAAPDRPDAADAPRQVAALEPRCASTLFERVGSPSCSPRRASACSHTPGEAAAADALAPRRRGHGAGTSPVAWTESPRLRRGRASISCHDSIRGDIRRDAPLITRGGRRGLANAIRDLRLRRRTSRSGTCGPPTPELIGRLGGEIAGRMSTPRPKLDRATRRRPARRPTSPGGPDGPSPPVEPVRGTPERGGLPVSRPTGSAFVSENRRRAPGDGAARPGGRDQDARDRRAHAGPGADSCRTCRPRPSRSGSLPTVSCARAGVCASSTTSWPTRWGRSTGERRARSSSPPPTRAKASTSTRAAPATCQHARGRLAVEPVVRTFVDQDDAPAGEARAKAPRERRARRTG